jgi:GNAT superfamily N-acetyltransferase
MEIKKRDLTFTGKKLILEIEGIKVGRISIIYINNDLHEEPYALIEDLYIEENERKKGYARKLFELAIEEAKKHRTYKIIATSRYSREQVHQFYLRLGFKDYGKEFRLDLK